MEQSGDVFHKTLQKVLINLELLGFFLMLVWDKIEVRSKPLYYADSGALEHYER
jgi:hypothetical protein